MGIYSIYIDCDFMIARPKLNRNVSFFPSSTYFKPRGIPMRELDVVRLSKEEAEAIRLYEVEEMKQVDAAKKMNTSQSTLQRILDNAHKKIGDALIHGKAIEIIE